MSDLIYWQHNANLWYNFRSDHDMKISKVIVGNNNDGGLPVDHNNNIYYNVITLCTNREDVNII